MESISSLKKQLTAKNKEIDQLRQYHNNPEVAKAKKAYDEALQKARDGIAEKLHKIREEQSAIEKKIDDLGKQKEVETPQEVKEFLDKLYKGVNWGGSFNVRWVSTSKRFIIATRSGGTYWSGRMQRYGSAAHYLFDITKSGSREGGGFAHGMEVCDACGVFKAKGRLSKETIAQWKEHAIKEEEK